MAVIAMQIEGVIFDLDGVIVSTDEYHYQSWQQLADIYGIDFDRSINHKLRGLSRMESLEIFLINSKTSFSPREKEGLASKKNDFYLQMLDGLDESRILPGVLDAIREFKRRSLRIAIGSSSKNCAMILSKIGLSNTFDACVDGNDVDNGKPHPEIFLKAASKINIQPKHCLVIEDGDPGVEAANAAGMRVLGVGPASNNSDAHFTYTDLSKISYDEILSPLST